MADEKQVKSSFAAKIRNYFFTGILVTLPAAITIYLAVVFINYIDSNVTKFIPLEYNPKTYLPYGIPGLGVIILMALFILIGMFATGFLGRFFIRMWEKLLVSTPIISSIYNTLKQIFETFCSSSAKNSFREVVLVQYPRKGLWTVAFVTGSPTQEIKTLAGQDKMLSIYVPTTPNPTSGFLIFLPESEVQKLDISVEEGLKFVISVGIVLPVSKKEQLDRAMKKQKPPKIKPAKKR